MPSIAACHNSRIENSEPLQDLRHLPYTNEGRQQPKISLMVMLGKAVSVEAFRTKSPNA
jgi:hypothetical protein